MKAVYTVVLLTLLMTAAAFSQSYVWQHMGVFPPSKGVAGDTLFGNGMHGLAVDPDGKVWVQHYYAISRDSLLVPNYCADLDTSSVDSVEARKIIVRALYVYNPDGTQASFSPIKVLSLPGGKFDTLGGQSVYIKGRLVWHPVRTPNPGVGLRRDWNGNILAVYYNNVYKIDYKTGAGMLKFTVPSNGSCVAPGVDQDGNIFINRVVTGGLPIWVFDNTGQFLQNARDTLQGSVFSRAIDVSKDANDVYFCGFNQHTVIRFRNSSGSGILGPWSQVDSILKGFDCESVAWNTKTNQLWFASGSYNDMPNRYPGVTTSYDPAAWYAYNTTTGELTGEKINWNFYTPANAAERPRGIAFSPGGDTAYVCVFGGNAGPPPGLRWYTRKLASVEPVESGIPNEFSLTQNYPNPFNPTTEIQFSITKSGMTTLKVYDMLGQEIATLVNEELNVGTFKSKFDASRLSSGTYIYMLTSNGSRLAKKMMLVK